MNLELHQKRFFITRTMKIYDNKIFYKFSKFGAESEVNISFEELTNLKESHVVANFYVLLISALLFLIAFVSVISRNDKDFDPEIWIFWTIGFFISIAGYFILRENLWKIKVQNNTYLFIYKKIPEKNEVDDFIENLFEARDKYLVETYSELNKNVSYETQLNNLQWLKKVDAIDKATLEKKRGELNAMFNLEKKVIGFSK